MKISLEQFCLERRVCFVYFDAEKDKTSSTAESVFARHRKEYLRQSYPATHYGS